MRISSLHEFTEHHRYYIFRDFSLSALDLKTVHLIYQPMVGAAAAGLYQLLYHGVEEGRVGYSALEPQRMLFLNLGIEMNEQGRKALIAHASKLEAVGLLQSSRMLLPGGEDILYEYELQAPLSPEEFFRNQHLTMFLRDKVGKYAVISLREQFSAREPDELAQADLPKENISVPFYELFQLNMHGIDAELEQALAEVAPARQALPKPTGETAGIHYGDLILRFPRNSANRKFVEKLRGDEEQMGALNYTAYKYGLNVTDLSRLLDEDGVFTSGGELQFDELQVRASGIYRQERKRDADRQRAVARSASASQDQAHADDEAPEEHSVQAEYFLEVPAQLAGRCDKPQYNMLMRNEPHTRFLQRFFPGAVPEWVERVFERVDLSYKLPGAVINVLIHYVLGMNESQRVTKTFIEAVAANMLLKQVDTFEKAALYLRDQAKVEEQKDQRKNPAVRTQGQNTGKRSGYARGGAQKPAIPIVEKRTGGQQVTPEELEEIRKLAKKLDGQG